MPAGTIRTWHNREEHDMSSRDEELRELQDDIERRSSQRPGSGTPEDLRDAAAEAHRAKQGAIVDMSGSPAPGFKDPADLFPEPEKRVLEPVDVEAIGRMGLAKKLLEASLSLSKNPHAYKMVMEAEVTGEPLFCFRARDFFSIQVIAFYANIVEQYGPDDAHFHNNIVDALGEFKEWQKDHINEVRYPD